MYKNLASENFSAVRTNILKFVIKLSEKNRTRESKSVVDNRYYNWNYKFRLTYHSYCISQVLILFCFNCHIIEEAGKLK